MLILANLGQDGKEDGILLLANQGPVEGRRQPFFPGRKHQLFCLLPKASLSHWIHLIALLSSLYCAMVDLSHIDPC